MGYSANGNHGMMQIYLGPTLDLSTMIPVDIPQFVQACRHGAAAAQPHLLRGRARTGTGRMLSPGQQHLAALHAQCRGADGLHPRCYGERTVQ